MIIPFNKPSIEDKEIDNILNSIRSGKIAGDGKYNNLCQEEITRTFGAKKVLLTTSGTSALEMAALLSDFKPGDEVIIPSFTFVSTANAFCLWGAKPVFIDIRPDTLNMDESLIEKAITEKTKAIVPVHYSGVACEMDRINELARQYNLTVIEDAAQAFLSTYRGNYTGTLGNIGCFSFHETKTIISGEGGAIVINNENDIQRAEIIREKGTNRSAFFRGEVDKYTWIDLGSSFLPSDITGAFLYGQWCARDCILSKRKAIYDHYDLLFRPLSEKGIVQTPVIPESCSINYHQFFIIVENADTQKNLLDFLHDENVFAVFHFIPLHNSPYSRKMKWDHSLPVTENIAYRIIRLPFFNSISYTEQERVAKLVYRFFGQ